jgi:hypothetical protein
MNTLERNRVVSRALEPEPGEAAGWARIVALMISLVPMLAMLTLAIATFPLAIRGVEQRPGHGGAGRETTRHLDVHRPLETSRSTQSRKVSCADGIETGELTAIAGEPKVIKAPRSLVTRCGPLKLKVFPDDGVRIEKARAGRWRLLVPRVGQFFYRFETPVETLDGHNLFVYESPRSRQSQRLATRLAKRSTVSVDQSEAAIASGESDRLTVLIEFPSLDIAKGLSGIYQLTVCVDVTGARLLSAECHKQLVDASAGERVSRSFGYSASTSGTIKASIEIIIEDPERGGISGSKVVPAQKVREIDSSLTYTLREFVASLRGPIGGLVAALVALLGLAAAWLAFRRAKDEHAQAAA